MITSPSSILMGFFQGRSRFRLLAKSRCILRHCELEDGLDLEKLSLIRR